MIASIPIAVSVAAGHVAALPFDTRVRDAPFPTASTLLFVQLPAFGSAMTLIQAVVLLVPLFAQLFIPIESVRFALAWCYLVLALIYLVEFLRRVAAFSAVKQPVLGGGNRADREHA